ncbi:hypothetical protein BDZ45DRAFT_446852 [Acephala macrosclerotiorum]|nr:hypothetical protein BDZ45DRAFT_446852 [Acephala macrosclerotiorum]
MATSASLSLEIDHLFEHYLSLLDQYTTLRTQLSALQISGQQHLARAKFHAPNGVVYGESMYDGRMQAQRRCCVTEGLEGEVLTGVEVVTIGEGGEQERGDSDASEKEKGDTADGDAEDENDNTAAYRDTSNPSSNTADEKNEKVDEKKKTTTKAKDPIRMFGLLTPDALKKAQADSIRIVETAIPELCRVNAEMQEVEIKIRRARKYRAKAEEKELKDMGKKENVPSVAGLSIEA